MHSFLQLLGSISVPFVGTERRRRRDPGPCLQEETYHVNRCDHTGREVLWESELFFPLSPAFPSEFSVPVSGITCPPVQHGKCSHPAASPAQACPVLSLAISLPGRPCPHPAFTLPTE